MGRDLSAGAPAATIKGMNPLILAEGDRLPPTMNVVPVPVFLMDADARIVDCNEAARETIRGARHLRLRSLCGDVLHCVNACSAPEACGKTESCKDCKVRGAIRSAIEGNPVRRLKANMRVMGDGPKGGERPLDVFVSAARIDGSTEPRVMLVMEDVSELAALHRMLPICAYCRKVRDDRESWGEIEAYVRRNMDVEFSHGICPDCMRKNFPGYEADAG